MTDLRAALIEAIARRLAEHKGFVSVNEATVNALHPWAEDLLDAVLDTLADRADEWDDLAFERCVGDRPGMVGPSDYLAVLRGDTQ